MAFRSDLHESEVQFHRGLYKIRPVELHEMPAFWMQRVCWATSGWGYNAAHNGMQALDGEVRLFDHWGKSHMPNGQPSFVTEPYNHEHIDSIAQGIARRLGLHARRYSPWQSWWFPGNTQRIEFWECLCTPLCRNCKSRQQVREEGQERKRRRNRS